MYICTAAAFTIKALVALSLFFFSTDLTMPTSICIIVIGYTHHNL